MHPGLLLLPVLFIGPPTDYSALKLRIEARRQAFGAQYAQADSAGRAIILESARTYLFDRITLDLLPAWYGTPWDFNGTTRTPGEGAIACGYFVNTVLQDAGFRLPRIKWSQMAAEPVTLKLSHEVKRFRDRPVGEVITYVVDRGNGLYNVGLDNHVGFVVVRAGVARFVHSNYYHREVGVMSEPLDSANPLADSRYRLLGRLLGDEMMMAWVQARALGQ